MRLILIRHAQTEHNRDNRVQGRADHPLSALGRRQAAALGERLGTEPIVAVYSSPLIRALTTAEAVAAPHGLRAIAEPDLVEMHVGELEGVLISEMRERQPEFLKVWATEQGPAVPMPGGESLEQVRDRAWAVVERLYAEHAEATVALVAHNFVLGCLITRALNLPLSAFRRFRFGVAGATTLRFRGERIALVHFNETCHLAPLDGGSGIGA